MSLRTGSDVINYDNTQEVELRAFDARSRRHLVYLHCVWEQNTHLAPDLINRMNLCGYVLTDSRVRQPCTCAENEKSVRNRKICSSNGPAQFL